MKRILSTFCIVLSLVSGALAATEWKGPEEIRQAARQGHPEAQLEMGILYEFGFFMAENEVPALAWYILAAEQGNARAARLRDKLKRNMTPAEIGQAQRLGPTLVEARARPAPQSEPQKAPPAR